MSAAVANISFDTLTELTEGRFGSSRHSMSGMHYMGGAIIERPSSPRVPSVA